MFLVITSSEVCSVKCQSGCWCPTRHALPCIIPMLIRAKNGNKGMLVQQHIQTDGNGAEQVKIIS